MTTKKISGFPTSNALNGSEFVLGIQNGLTVKLPASSLGSGGGGISTSAPPSANLIRSLTSWTIDSSDLLLNNISKSYNYSCLKLSSTNPAFIVTDISADIKAEADQNASSSYVLSFLAWTLTDTRDLRAELYPNTLPGSTVTVTTTPNLFSLAWVTTSTDIIGSTLRFIAQSGIPDIYVCNVKLEVGTVRTQWSPSVHDSINDLNPLTNYNITQFFGNVALDNEYIGDVIQSSGYNELTYNGWKLNKLGDITTYGNLVIKSPVNGNVIFAAGNFNWNNVTGTNIPAPAATRNVYAGQWSQPTVYYLGDWVVDIDGYSWNCILAHTSNNTDKILPIIPVTSNTYWNAYGIRKDPITIENPNSTHAFSAENDGTVPSGSYTDSGTTITVYEGAKVLLYDGTGTSSGTWKTTTTPTNITVGTLTDSGTYLSVGAHSGVEYNIDSSSIIYSIIGKRYDGTSFNTETRQTFSKSKAGGSSVLPILYAIETDTPVIVKDAPSASSVGTYTPITIQGKKTDNITTSNYGWVTVTTNLGTEATTATNTATSPYVLSLTETSGVSSITIKMYNQATVSGAILLDTQVVDVVYKGDVGQSYQVVIESSNGTEFKVGQASTTTLKARLFLNGEEITVSTPASWFKWRRVSMYPDPYPNDDDTWYYNHLSGYKEITVNIDEVDSQATFFCDIISP